MPEEPGIREVRLGVYATERQADEVRERIARLLCPDPDHAPPSPIPWSAHVPHGSDLEDGERYAELVEQAESERRLQP